MQVDGRGFRLTMELVVGGAILYLRVLENVKELIIRCVHKTSGAIAGPFSSEVFTLRLSFRALQLVDICTGEDILPNVRPVYDPHSLRITP